MVQYLNTAGSGIDFCYEIGSYPFVVTLLYGSIGFHILNVDEDLIAHRIYKGIFSVCVHILFVALLGLLSKGFKLGNDLVELVGDGVGSVEQSFLGGCQLQ
jgi:hypothetical protein